MQGIQHPAHHGRKRHTGQIGEHDDREPHRIVELHRIVGEARRNDRAHDKRHGEFHRDGDEKQHSEKNAKHFFRKATSAFHTVLFNFLGEKWHKSCVERAFGK